MKLITLEELYEHHDKQLNYFKTELIGSSIPNSLFKNDGTFNDSNWNSGEAIPLRKVINDFENDKQIFDIDLDYYEGDLNVSGSAFITKYYRDDTTWFIVNTDVDVYRMDEGDFLGNHIDNYTVRIYKSRGGIERIYRNGEPIKRNEYLSLLHILQGTRLLKR